MLLFINERENKVRKILLVLLSFGLIFGAAGVASANDSPYDCDHGNSDKPCRPDPQPDHGKDCDQHGNNGGKNEDHCLTTTTTAPPVTTTTQPPTTNTTAPSVT